MDPDRGLVQISYFLVWCVVSVLLIVLYMRITLCNYKNGLLTSFSLGGASTLAERLKVFFISRRTKVKGRRIIAIIFVFILNGAPNQIRTDDPILTMDVLYQLSLIDFSLFPNNLLSFYFAYLEDHHSNI